MRPFAYERATDAGAAVAAMDDGARYLGGGTNLVDLMKLGVEAPVRLVDVTRLPHAAVEDTSGGGLQKVFAIPPDPPTSREMSPAGFCR